MFFTSSREDGLGGGDIYMSSVLPDGSWDRAINLGSVINTKGDEEAPFISNDGKKLVFTRRNKKRNEDIFYSQKKEEEWMNGKAYGSSINSDKNEGMAKFETHGKTFYFAGCLREDTEGGCDIYKATIQEDDDVDAVSYTHLTLPTTPYV